MSFERSVARGDRARGQSLQDMSQKPEATIKEKVKHHGNGLELAEIPSPTVELPPVKPTFKRWIILLLFCATTGNKSFQWIQVPATTTKATVFYGVENYVINISSIIFMVAFVVVSWPACYLVQRIGIRKAILLASFGTILGSLIKCCSCYEDAVWLLLLAQVVIALSQQLVHQIPPRIASLWFPDNQVSSCVAGCMFGNQFGFAVGFLVPQWLLQDANTKDEIGHQFFNLFLITLGYSAILFVANWFLFDEAPAYPPGLARQRQIAFEKDSKVTNEMDGSIKDMIKKILQLYRNRDLVLMSISYGMTYGRSDTIATLLDQTIQPIFPDAAHLVGNVGFIIIVSGAIGAPVWGRIMDMWRAFKMINVLIGVFTTISLVLFAYSLVFLRLEWGIYIAAALFGFSQSGFFVCSMEFAIELAYPAPEMITSSIMFIMPSFFGPFFIVIGSYVVDNYGALASIIFYLGTLLVSLLCIILCRERLRRQEAVKLQRDGGNVATIVGKQAEVA